MSVTTCRLIVDAEFQALIPPFTADERAQLEAPRDPVNPMDVDRASAIRDVATAIIASAKVEVDLAQVTGQESASRFLRVEASPLPTGIVGVRQHRLK